VQVAPAQEGYAVTEGGTRRSVTTRWRVGEPIFRGSVDGHSVTIQVDRDGIGYRLTYRGMTLPMTVLPPHAAALLAQMPVKAAPDLSRYLLSPMPGLLVSVAVAEGQDIKAGEELVVVEAMKMENVLRAERDGRVAKVRAKAGDSLAVDQVILEFA
ncbi:MAG: biotin/lipoyl-containing protein, partial [Roseiarcus sp.]